MSEVNNSTGHFWCAGYIRTGFFFRASTPAFAEGVDLAEGMTLVGSRPRQIVAIRTMIPVGLAGLAGWLAGWLFATPTPNNTEGSFCRFYKSVTKRDIRCAAPPGPWIHLGPLNSLSLSLSSSVFFPSFFLSLVPHTTHTRTETQRLVWLRVLLRLKGPRHLPPCAPPCVSPWYPLDLADNCSPIVAIYPRRSFGKSLIMWIVIWINARARKGETSVEKRSAVLYYCW